MIRGSRRTQDIPEPAPRLRGVRLVLFWLAGLAVACRAAESAPAIHWRTEAAPKVTVEVTGISSGKDPGAFSLHAEQVGNVAGLPAVSGALRIEQGTLKFEPAFPLQRGVRYRAEFRTTADAPPLVSYFELPARPAGKPTVVAQIFPSADVLPENQLKFYVLFSAPMSRGGIYEHIRLRDAAGTTIEMPFLELGEELWDPAMTRVTLLIDPGRIKRGVKPLVDMGPVFEAGKNYTLAIDAAWPDAVGQPLKGTFEKNFRVGPADRTPPDPARWKMQTVRAGKREPLIVEFDEPMDHALALRLISVRGFGGDRVAGESALAEHERRWSFTPAQPWETGVHMLAVATTIEDLAGNNIGKPFDVDVFEKVDRRIATELVQVSFEVK